MKASLKTLVAAFAVALVAAALLAPIAGAGGSTTGTAANGMMGGGTSSGMGAWAGTGMWGMGSGMGSGMGWLIDNPAALQAWLQLRTEHRQAMKAWYDAHKADLTSTAAQQALHDLWTAHWNDMRDFHEQYASGTDGTPPAMGMWGGWQMGDMMGGGSWNPRHMWGTGFGASWMTSHPTGMGQWLTIRGRQIGAMNAWSRQHGAALGSPTAQAALKTLRAHQRTQVKRFFQQHHLSATSSRMRSATGGWMGLGGMWGGFGW